MATITLNRLPLQAELDTVMIEMESFIEAFQEKTISGFTANVEIEDGVVLLDGLALPPGKWYKVN